MDQIIDRYGYIYKITNKINGKIYVGKRAGSSIDEDYWGSGTKIKNALKEFGCENFKREIIEWCSTKDILRDRERYWVDKLDARNPEVGYNLKKGTEEGVAEEEMRGAVIISVQIPRENLAQLKLLAREECTSVSYLIRKALLKFIREEDK